MECFSNKEFSWLLLDILVQTDTFLLQEIFKNFRKKYLNKSDLHAADIYFVLALARTAALNDKSWIRTFNQHDEYASENWIRN